MTPCLQGLPSGKVQEGVQRCALRAIHSLAQQREMHEALVQAGIPDLLQVGSHELVKPESVRAADPGTSHGLPAVQVLLKDEGFCLNSDLASSALGTLQHLGQEGKVPAR